MSDLAIVPAECTVEHWQDCFGNDILILTAPDGTIAQIDEQGNALLEMPDGTHIYGHVEV